MAVVFVELVFQALEWHPQAGGGALAAARVGADHLTHDLAAAFKNFPGHFLVSLVGGWGYGLGGLGERVLKQAGDQLNANLTGEITHDGKGNAAIGERVGAGPAVYGLGDCAWLVALVQGELAEAQFLLDQLGLDLALVQAFLHG